LVGIAHRRGAAVLVDAAQTIGVLAALDLHAADAVAFSGHKGLRALPGIGVLVLRDVERIEPIMTGGTGHDADSPDMPTRLPERLEPGTLNLPGIASLGATLAATTRAWDPADARSRLQAAVLAGGGNIVGHGELPVVSFTLADTHPAIIEEALDRGYQIVARAGLQCAALAHRYFHTTTTGVLRVSSGRETTDGELELLTTALRDIGAMPRPQK
jgi:selenocysteine lyase/cysteine desulfurase